ncbi:MAG: TPM domain-containing protein, partial [Clostridia bacterium]|nr:TPM domain-containing protein [Clostridia bacterium]
MNKRILTFLCCIALGWLCVLSPAPAESLSQPCIQDDADLLSAEEEAALYQDMLPLCEYGVPVFCTADLSAGSNEALAERLLRQYVPLGESGLIFLINMGVRQLTVYADGAIYRVIGSGEAETLTDNAFRLARGGDYYACAQRVFSQALALLRGEKIARPMKITSNLLLALVLALLLVYLYISRKYETRPKAGNIKGAALPVTAGAAAAFTALNMNRRARMTKQKKIDISSHSGGGGHGGGGGGGGGGGHSG